MKESQTPDLLICLDLLFKNHRYVWELRMLAQCRLRELHDLPLSPVSIVAIGRIRHEPAVPAVAREDQADVRVGRDAGVPERFGAARTDRLRRR